MAEEEVKVEQTDEQIVEEVVEKKDEKKEEVGDDSTNLEKEETSEEEKEESVEEESTEEISLRPSYKEITKKYPTFFKDFPDLRHAIFAEQKYREIYSTVEEAQETRDNYKVIANIHERFLSGTADGISAALKEIRSSDESALKDIASNFLVALYKTSKEDYESATAPIFESLLRSVYKDGVSSKNQNLENAALLISEYLFGDEDIATGKKTVRKSETPQNTKEQEKLEKERKDFNTQRYMALSRDVSDFIQRDFPKEISKGISVDSPELRNILTKEVYASGKAGGGKSVKYDSTKIDYRKTSDADIFDDKVVLKK